MKKATFCLAAALSLGLVGFTATDVSAAKDLTRNCGNYEVAAGPLTGIYTMRWEKKNFRLNGVNKITCFGQMI